MSPSTTPWVAILAAVMILGLPVSLLTPRQAHVGVTIVW
jgi:hypothetical protein